MKDKNHWNVLLVMGLALILNIAMSVNENKTTFSKDGETNAEELVSVKHFNQQDLDFRNDF